MNAVLGISRLLADTNLSLEQQQYVTMIMNSGHLLLTIINDILDFSKIEAGQLKLSRSPHNLADIIESAILLCYEMSTSKGLYLSWFIDPNIPAVLLIDSTRLQQILLNLLSNALKFTKEGGVMLEVLLVTDSFSPALLKSNHVAIEIRVIDSGIGISPEQLSTLFQSFSQVHHSQDYGQQLLWKASWMKSITPELNNRQLSSYLLFTSCSNLFLLLRRWYWSWFSHFTASRRWYVD